MKKLIVAVVVIGLAGFLWWAFSPLLFTTTVNDELPVGLTTPAPLPTQEPKATTSPDTESSASETTEPPAPTITETVQNLGPFPINDTPGHPASGFVRLLITPEEQLVRYENYQGTNGPDLKIYLSKDLEATDYINLGEARGNAGNINYGVPLDVDLSEYKYVLTWCEAFGVLFDYAEIN